MTTYPYMQGEPAGMPIFAYFATVSVVLSVILFFGVDILYPSEPLAVQTLAAPREPSKLERAITDQKAEQQREASRQAAAELQKIESERATLAATPPVIGANDAAEPLPPKNPSKLPQVHRSPTKELFAKSNRSQPNNSAYAASPALGYAAEPPIRSFAPFARSDFPY